MIVINPDKLKPVVTVESIDEQLAALDAQSARPLRTILVASDGDNVSAERDSLADIESQAIILRKKRAALT